MARVIIATLFLGPMSNNIVKRISISFNLSKCSIAITHQGIKLTRLFEVNIIFSTVIESEYHVSKFYYLPQAGRQAEDKIREIMTKLSFQIADIYTKNKVSSLIGVLFPGHFVIQITTEHAKDMVLSELTLVIAIGQSTVYSFDHGCSRVYLARRVVNYIYCPCLVLINKGQHIDPADGGSSSIGTK